MAGKPDVSPYSRFRAVAGLFCFVIVGILAIIDALSPEYMLEIGPMGLLLGTGSVLLGVEGIRKAAERIVNGGQ